MAYPYDNSYTSDFSAPVDLNLDVNSPTYNAEFIIRQLWQTPSPSSSTSTLDGDVSPTLSTIGIDVDQLLETPTLGVQPPDDEGDLFEFELEPSVSIRRNRKKAKDDDHIPRPKNAFLFFREDLKGRIPSSVGKHQSSVSKIAGSLWHALPSDQRQKYEDKAAMAKARHAEMYPGYRFRPHRRAAPRKKRNLRRDPAEETKWCNKVATLIKGGKEGQELSAALRASERRPSATETTEAQSPFEASQNALTSTAKIREVGQAGVSGKDMNRSPLIPPFLRAMDPRMPKPTMPAYYLHGPNVQAMPAMSTDMTFNGGVLGNLMPEAAELLTNASLWAGSTVMSAAAFDANAMRTLGHLQHLVGSIGR